MTPPLLEPAVVGPLVMVSVGALMVLMGEVLLSRAHTFMSRAVTPSYIGVLLATLTLLFLGVAGVLTLQQATWPDPVAFNPANPMLIADALSSVLSILILLTALLVCALAVTYLDELDINHGEFYALVLFSTAGMTLVVSAVDLLVLYLGIELMSLPIYVLAGFDRTRLRSNEAGVKYFLLGGFASAIMLYGMALLYGVAGSTGYDALAAALTPENPMGLVGVGLLIAGLGCKLGAVPFHQWAPDVYEGSPSVVTAFMAVAVKVAAVGALLRICATAFTPVGEILHALLAWLAIATLLVGALMACIQENVKRLLAYSTIAHGGFLLAALSIGTVTSYGAAVFYLVCYAFTNLGAFAVVVSLAHRGRDFERVSDFAGLQRSRPGLAAAMTLFVVSLAGVPMTAGFMARWRVLASVIESGHMLLAIVSVLATVVLFYAYLRIPISMWMQEPSGEPPRPESTTPELFVLALCAALVLYLGVFPDALFPTLTWAQQSVADLF